MTRLESLLHPGETVLWRTVPAWRSARNNLLLQVAPLILGSFLLSLLIDGFDADRLESMLLSLLAVSVPALVWVYFTRGNGVLVTDRRVLRGTGVFRRRREELERRHIAGAVLYAGDESLVLRATRPDVIRLLEPNSRASLQATGDSEMPFPQASVDNDEMLEALGIEPLRIEPVRKPDAVSNLHGARITLAFVVALFAALAVGLAKALIVPGLAGVFLVLSILVALGGGAMLGLWLVWPVARLTVSAETARVFACTLHHPDWKAIYPQDESWRDSLRRAERRLARLYGESVDLASLPRPEDPAMIVEVQP